MLSWPRRMLKLVHPEGIPFPGSFIYNLASKSNVFQRNYEMLAEDIVKYISSGSLLDVGTGPGYLLIKLYNSAPGLKLFGADISLSMVDQAQKNMAQAGLAGEVEIREGSAGSLPFPDNSLDAVVSSGSIHHWKDPWSGLNDIHRVLKPGGYALIYDVVSDTPKEVLKDMGQKLGRLPMFMLWLHAFEEPFYSQKELLALPVQTPFKTGRLYFAGVLAGLVMQKRSAA